MRTKLHSADEVRSHAGEMATLRFDVEAGLLIRRQVAGEIQRAAFKRDLKCEFVEAKGLFQSRFTFKIEGPAETVADFMEALPRLEGP